MDKDLKSSEQATEAPTVSAGRRRALKRLGLAIAVAYAAPTVTAIDRHALAQSLPSPACPPGRPGCGPLQ